MRVRAAFLAVLVLALFPVAASANYAHVVQPGETLTSVAAVDGLSIDAIARANGISPMAQLIAGQTLWIPPRTAARSATGSSTDADEDADVDQATTSATSTTSTTTAAAATTGSATTTSAAQTGSHAPTSASGAVPTAERVSSGEIAGVADANAVPAALAEAIAWQESGWNNDEVSSIGAVGVMQIVPKTWVWIDRFLTPADPLQTASAADNIRAGVLLLRQLLSLTGGNQQLAVAGYFQGLASIKRFGMYPSTRHYVANVMALAQRFGA
jgi:soluble lytic murein transglycosylase-like protein